MIKLENILLIGSTGRNVGKTELACRLIKKFSKTRNVIGVKVTTIHDNLGKCPHGGQGCGVCSSIEGKFYITEETDAALNKDTSRLLAAGAKKVFWLRVLVEHMADGAAELAKLLPADAAVVCESNSIRKAVAPGLFLMTTTKDAKDTKESAKQMKKYVDAVVVSNGESFNFDIERVKFKDNKWILRVDATAIILAGGNSSRMGEDKSMLELNGKTLIENNCDILKNLFSQVIISANDKAKYEFLGLEVVPDKALNQGPLMAIASTLQASDNQINFVLACDIIDVDIELIKKMLVFAEDFDAVVPRTADGKFEPLFAIYRKNLLAPMNEALDSGIRKIDKLYDSFKLKYVDLKPGHKTINLNTKDDYERAKKANDKF